MLWPTNRATLYPTISLRHINEIFDHDILFLLALIRRFFLSIIGRNLLLLLKFIIIPVDRKFKAKHKLSHKEIKEGMEPVCEFCGTSFQNHTV